MTEDMLSGLFIYCLIAFLVGEALGIMTCAICAGWYDKAMKELEKRKGRRRGNVSDQKEG